MKIDWMWICIAAMSIAAMVTGNCNCDTVNDRMRGCRTMCQPQGAAHYDPNNGTCTCQETLR